MELIVQAHNNGLSQDGDCARTDMSKKNYISERDSCYSEAGQYDMF